ncbi:nucleotide-binding protein [Arthrobacter sp. D1-29]
MSTIFFGYPEQPPANAEVMRNTAQSLGSDSGITATTWQDLTVDGRIVIDQVLDAIDNCDMAVFDITSLNSNVLFELGYAVGRGKIIWLTLDSTDSRAKKNWKDLAILSNVGYTAYRNSDDLVKLFYRNKPLLTPDSLYDKLIEPALPEHASDRRSILYCTTFEPFEASNKLSNMLDERQRRGQSVTTSDPGESSLIPIDWFAPRIASAAGVLVNFAGAKRNRANIHNNRHALVAGLATGLETPVLMLAEGDYPAPFDYEAKLRIYETAEECVEEARKWLDNLEYEGISWNAPRSTSPSALGGLRFGEHVAENERTELAEYFVETSAYHEVVAARDSIFVGHRGTGKTANAMQAYQHIAANKTNLAILIKPSGFEFPAMLAVVLRLSSHQQDYFFDSLWRFIIQTEIASAMLQRLRSRSSFVPFSADEQAFIDYASSTPFDMDEDISVRLEQTLMALTESLAATTTTLDTERNLINEAFHTEALATLRAQLGHVLKGKKRVAVFVDNLDKGWERGADFKVMARFILGLLTARGRVVTDFEKEDYWRTAIKLTVSVFLRSDIYTYLRREAREPDKLPISTISWRDAQTLKSVIESRFIISEAHPDRVSELWEKYFCPSIGNLTTGEYLTKVTLPRPRDVVFFCNAAVGKAIDRRHTRVESDDFLAAEEVYSQYAYEALLVENGVTIPEMEDALLSFIDSTEIATAGIRKQELSRGGLGDDRIEPILDKLLSMSFFGIEISEGVFAYPEVGSDMAAASARAKKYEPHTDSRRLIIHRAFRTFLGINTTNGNQK